MMNASELAKKWHSTSWHLQVYRRFLRLKYDRFRQGHPWAHQLIRWSARVFVLALSTFAILFALVFAGAFGPVPGYPELRQIRNHTASELYSEDGVLLGRYYLENRVNAKFEELSPYLSQALIATEDARFFEHRGIDFRAAVRVAFKSILLRDERSGGGSTLSQQLAKNLFPRQSFRFLSTPVNKFREMIVARRLEKIYSKEELLLLYLNTVPFSEQVFGVKVAAQRFFQVSASDIRPEQAAVLIGMLKGTSAYNPLRHPERALERRNVVLRQMAKYDYLREAEADSLCALPMELAYYDNRNAPGTGAYFREHLRLELDELLRDFQHPSGRAYNLYTDGLRIYTTIDSRMQRHAEEAVSRQLLILQQRFTAQLSGAAAYGGEKHLRQAIQNSSRYKKLIEAGYNEKQADSLFKLPVTIRIFDWQNSELEMEMSPLDSVKYYLNLLHAGFLAMDPRSGKVKAWVGGIDHRYFQYDHVRSRRQLGSAFKTILFAAALREGITPCDYFPNELISYPEYEDWTPENSDKQYGGAYSLAGALTRSVNTVAVQVIFETGMEPVIRMAKELGLEREVPALPAIALGAVEASLYELVQAYAAIANGGYRTNPWYIQRIETATGEVLLDFEEPELYEDDRVLTKEEAALLTHLLEGVVKRGTAYALKSQYRLPDGLGGKTGTSQNQADGWFVGITERLVVGAWVGAESPKVHWRTLNHGQGSATALPLAGIFLQKLQQDAALRPYHWHPFRPLSEELAEAINCTDFLEELPNFNENTPMDFLQKFLRIFQWERKQNPDDEDVEANEEPQTNTPRERRNPFKGLFKRKN
jgi:penicillin-binding protein 1A